MASDLLWVLIVLLFAVPGLKFPYLALCGVIFVDIVRPQTLSYSFLAGKPLSLFILLIFFTSLLINWKQLSIPRNKKSTIALIFFMGWITLATYHAEFQSVAWVKYDYVIKFLLLPLFIPFVLNSRVKIDTFIAVMVCSVSFFTMILGMKFITGGHGYEQSFIYSTAENTGMTESSTMAMLAVMNLPFIIYLLRYSIFKDKIPFFKPASYFLGFTCILSAIGSYARTGLLGLFIWVVLLLKQSQKKFKYSLIIFICALLFIPFAPPDWVERMNSTKSTSTDTSALGRIVVWKWTIDYVSERPLMGGGFQSFLANAGELNSYVDEDIGIEINQPVAFHNIYFEVLGELGYVGLFIYLWIIYLAFSVNPVLLNTNKSENWMNAQVSARKQALLLYCVCGSFIGVAYYPWLFYLLGLAISLDNVCSAKDDDQDKLPTRRRGPNP